MPSRKRKPRAGETYKDSDGRTLYVEEVVQGDPLGREVVGKIKLRGERKRRSYATTLPIWQAVWRDRNPRADPRLAKIG